ncbi:hypothetical protein Peur_021247 [Populus x canadensis]
MNAPSLTEKGQILEMITTISIRKTNNSHYIAMEMFTKKLTSIDLQRELVLPRDSNLERLQPFHGTIELSTIVESSAGNCLPDPVTIHCSTRSGKLVLTRGWHDIARDAGLRSGDIVNFTREENGGAQYKMRVRNVG